MSSILYLTFKSPQIDDQVVQYCEENHLDYDDIMGKLSKWIEWNEYLVVKFDMVDNTAEVMPR